MTGTLPAEVARPVVKPGYRPELQGLRALAVTLVVLYHVWFDRVSGGVDVFFLITGFLLTGQLFRAARRGPLGLRRRWGRTCARLVPSAAVVLATTVVAGFLVLPEGRWNQTLREIGASALFGENWQLAADSVDYAARSNTTSVVQHFWSLSIQGQFFVLWPLLVAAVAWWARRTSADLHARLTTTVLVVFGASLAYSVRLTATDQPLAYFHSLTRVWEFALGALLALWIDRIAPAPRVRAVLGWVGVVGLVACGLLVPVQDVFPGVIALWPTGCGALVLVAGRTGLPYAADRLLASRPARYLGDLSYTLYLWHWPVLILYLVAQDQDVAGLRGGLGVIVLSVLLAVLTHHLVEERFLGRGGGYRIGAIGTAVVLLLVGGWHAAAAVEAIPRGTVGDAQHPGASALTGRGVAQADLLPPPVSVYGDFWHPDAGWACSPLPQFPESDACTQPVTAPARRVVVVGDSHAEQFTAALVPIAERRHWQLITMQRGACPFSTTSDSDPNQRGCVEWNAAAVERIAELKPDLVVAQASLEVRVGLKEKTTPGMVAQWAKVTALGVPVLAFRDNPRFDFGVPDCVQEHGRDSARCGVDRDQVYAATPSYARMPGVPVGVTFLDLADVVCTATRCPSEIGNVLVYLDDNHLSASFARSMAPVIEPRVVAAAGW